ncbi:NAD(P)H-dependent oxidoreductase [Aerococcaceae bacterium zg-ZUI334]|uniref:NADPH-dependent FMN reductase n=1 Tax=Aerococcaceae bacterium zg-252 TaxID=2796928 RepID=UPI001B9F4F96|nr:NAD(P)H-dependent oxidoreductase [Aerococcaceae bacterium zg-ZUI334]
MSKKVLVFSGSDRQGSFNAQLAEQLVAALNAKGVDAAIYDYSEVPLLSQNTEYPAPASVVAVRDEVAAADALLFVSPEYNGSYPARLKNLIDWLSRPVVAFDNETPTVLAGKKVAVASAANSTYGKFVRGALNFLLPYVRTAPMESEGLGIKIPGEAWATGTLALEPEQQEVFDAFVNEFVAYVEA